MCVGVLDATGWGSILASAASGRCVLVRAVAGAPGRPGGAAATWCLRPAGCGRRGCAKPSGWEACSPAPPRRWPRLAVLDRARHPRRRPADLGPCRRRSTVHRRDLGRATASRRGRSRLLRTCLDCCPCLPLRDAVVVGDSALRAGPTRAASRRRPQPRGLAPRRRACRTLLDAKSESVIESRACECTRRGGRSRRRRSWIQTASAGWTSSSTAGGRRDGRLRVPQPRGAATGWTGTRQRTERPAT